MRAAGEGRKGKGDDDHNQSDEKERRSSSQMVHGEHHVIHSAPTFLPAVGRYFVGSLEGEVDEAEKRWRASLIQRALLLRV